MKTACSTGSAIMSDQAALEPVLASCRTRWQEGSDTARRLFHGRGHCYPGLEDLVVDRFGDVLLVGCFGENVSRARTLAALLAESLDGVGGVAVQQSSAWNAAGVSAARRSRSWRRQRPLRGE